MQTAGLRVLDVTERVRRFASEEARDGLVHVFLPHATAGHGGDHLLPVFVAPSLLLPVEAGRVLLGTWQSVVIVDPNRENDVRRVRLSFLPG